MVQDPKKKTSPCVAPKAAERPFGADIEHMLASDVFDTGGGYMNGSMSDESWKAFLKTVRDEAVAKLGAYRTDADHNRDFRSSHLEPYCERRMKIEREYLRSLVDLYCSAERAYKTLSG